MVISLSNLAKEVLLEAVESNHQPDRQVLRIEEREGRLQLAKAELTLCDRVVSDDRKLVIVISQDLENKMGDVLVDICKVGDVLKLMVVNQKNEEG